MTTDEKQWIVSEALAARVAEVMQHLPIIVDYARRGLPILAGYDLRDMIENLQACQRMMAQIAYEDSDGVPTESLICKACGEHESRCQCADACDVCGKMECDERHEQDAAAYEPRERF